MERRENAQRTAGDELTAHRNRDPLTASDGTIARSDDYNAGRYFLVLVPRLADPEMLLTAMGNPKSRQVWLYVRARHKVLAVRRVVGSSIAIVLLAPLVSACALPGSSEVQTQNDECVPTSTSVESPSDPDRRIEDIVEALTGERQTGDHDPAEETIDDPNFGGVWGDFQGGVVVAVLDCSKVDANQLAELAGGAEYLHLIEVPFTFKQVNGFRDALVQDLETVGVAGDVFIESTLTGRMIEVHVLEGAQLPDTFGYPVPADAFRVIEVEELVSEA